MTKNMDSNPKLIETQTLHANRPLSPHLSIYKIQLTSGLSILHRITGAYLYFGLILFAWSIFALSYFPYILENIGFCINNCQLTGILFKLMITGWVFSLFYHMLNGIRHLFWDIGKGFEIKTAYITGKIVIVLAIALTLFCWFLVSSEFNDKNDNEEVITESVVIEEQE